MNTYQVVIFTDLSTKLYHIRPLGAYRIASELRANGFSVLVIDYFGQWVANPAEFLNLIQTVISTETIVVGFSGTFFSQSVQHNAPTTYKDYFGGGNSPWPTDLQTIKILLARIKKINPTIKMIYGSSNTNVHYKYLDGIIDYAVLGFGETSIVSACQQIKNSKIPKFTIKNNIKLLQNCDTFNFSKSQTIFHKSDFIEPGEPVPFETARGCMFKCSFCRFPLLGRTKGDPDYHKSVAVLQEELERNYHDYGIHKYAIVDDTFNESVEKLRIFQKAVEGSKVPVKFTSYIRLDLIARFPEQISILKDAGIQSAYFGIESLNHQAARAIGKGIHPDKVKDTLGLIYRQMG